MKLSLSLAAKQRLVAIWTYFPCLIFVHLAVQALWTNKPFGYIFAFICLLASAAFLVFFRFLMKRTGPIPASEKHFKFLLIGLSIIVISSLLAGLLVNFATGRLPSSYPQILLMLIGFFPMLGGLLLKFLGQEL